MRPNSAARALVEKTDDRIGSQDASQRLASVVKRVRREAQRGAAAYVAACVVAEGGE